MPDGRCHHPITSPVHDVVGELVAHLCLICDAQLPADLQSALAPPASPRRTVRLIVVGMIMLAAFVVLVGLAFAAILAARPDGRSRAEIHPPRTTPTEPSEPSETVASDNPPLEPSYKVGDCLLKLTAGADPWETVPCEQPHEAEVFAVFELAEGKFPGDQKVFDIVDRECTKRFEEYVGVPYDESRFGMTNVSPADKVSWYYDRGVTCLILPDTGALTRSVKDAHQ
jgi:hypothetical protein